MDLVKTLAKVAMGVILARGVGKMANGGRDNSGEIGADRSGGGGGLGGLLDGLSGGGQTQGGDVTGGRGGLGGLGGLLDGLSGGAQRQGDGVSGGLGGLGGLLGGLLTGGRSGQSSGGGLGDILGSVLSGGGGGSGGGLGGLLDSLGGGAGRQGDGLGGMLNQALAGASVPEASPDQQHQAEILLRAMINAAKSDGTIDSAEQKKILEQLGDVTQEEISFVRTEMAQPVDVDGFVRSVPQGLEQQVYLMSLLGIDLDSQAEAQYLDRLAKGMGLTPDVVNQIHAQAGVPALYR